MTRALTHERCVNRCCCPSWSCEPHRADCEIVTGRHRVPTPFVGLGRAVAEASANFPGGRKAA